MSQSPFINQPQADALAALVRDGRRFAAVAVHPFSGHATCSRDGDKVIIDQEGDIVYDSTEPVKPKQLDTVHTIVIRGRFPDNSKCTISCSPNVRLDVASPVTDKVAQGLPCGSVRQGDRVWLDHQWLSVYATDKFTFSIPAR